MKLLSPAGHSRCASFPSGGRSLISLSRMKTWYYTNMLWTQIRNLVAMLCLSILFLPSSVLSNTHFVSLSGAGHWPYTNWTDAATSIQVAVDASVDGDVVFVTNGTYVSASQIIVTNGITIQSVNGASWTTVDGGYPWYTNRCIYLGHSNSVLTGFTITNGYAPGTEDSSEACGGGISAVSGALVWKCIITGNTAVYLGGGVSGGTVSNCLLIGNATVGGGWSGPGGGWSTPGAGGAAAGSRVFCFDFTSAS